MIVGSLILARVVPGQVKEGGEKKANVDEQGEQGEQGGEGKEDNLKIVEESKDKEKKKTSPPKGVNFKFQAVLKTVIDNAQRTMSHRNHLTLTSTFILPSHRKSNLGTALVQLALARAKELSLPLFLCSVPSARGFYLKSGFTDVAVGEVDLGAWGPEFGGFGRYRLSGMVVEN